MKKLAVGIVLLIVLSLLLLPFATGMISEDRLSERVSAMNDNPFMSAEVTSYERGWFTSTATIEFGLSQYYRDTILSGTGLFAPDLLSEPLIVIVDIAHGPIAVDEGVHFGMARVLARSDPDSHYARAIEAIGMPYLFEFRGRAGFGTFEFDADIPPASFADDSGELDFSGILVVGSASSGTLRVDANMAKASYEHPLFSLNVENVRLETETERMADSLVRLGGTDFTIARAVASSPLAGTAPVFALDALRFASSARLVDGGQSITSTADYSFDSVAAGDGFAMTGAQIAIRVERLDAAALQAYLDLVRAATIGQPGTDPGEVTSQVVPLITELLRAGPVLSIEPIRFSMGGGNFDGRLSIAVDADAVPNAAAIDLQGVMGLLTFLSAEGEAIVSKPLAERLAIEAVRSQVAATANASGESLAPDELEALTEAQAGFMLVSLTGQGFLSDDGESYSTELELVDGQLTVNGSPVPLGLP